MTTDTVPKILVVDDGPEIRNLVHRFLNQKYQVDLATDAGGVTTSPKPIVSKD